MDDDIRQLVQEQRDRIVSFRQDLHRIPETGFNEKKTADYVAAQLKEAGIEVQTGVGRTGVVGLLKGEAAPSNRVLMIRADMDALPIKEETNLPFASTHPNVMHACGHDGHMAMALGAAILLKRLQARWKGTIKFVFQPAEERVGGAVPMIEAGVMENPTVNCAIGCHIWPGLPEGTIGIRSGAIMAAMHRFDIHIIGRGGHGAMPHLCVDAVDVGAQVVNALQRVVSRQMNPLSPTVLTIGSFHAGSAFNVIAGEAILSGTARTFDRDIWRSWPIRIENIVSGVCQAMGAGYHVEYWEGFPPVVNDESVTKWVRTCAVQTVGEERVVDFDPAMTGEDMAFFLERTKGCYYLLGAGHKDTAPLHNSRFTFNEDILLTGVETHCRAALTMLAR